MRWFPKAALALNAAWSLALCESLLANANSPAEVLDLKTCGLVNPAAIDRMPPTLSWRMQSARQGAAQTAWHVLAASTPEKLAADQGDLWDSGEVVSDQSLFVSWQGKTPHSLQDVWWKVKLRDESGQWSAWSQTARWRAGLLDKADWHGAQWIGIASDTREGEHVGRDCLPLRLGKTRNLVAPPVKRCTHPSPLLRHEMELAKPVRRAIATVCGLGYFELYVNGERIGDHVLDPAQTSFDERAFYVTHDITAHLRNGKNALGMMLGNGFFGQDFAFNPNLQYGPPRARAVLHLEYADGTRQAIVTGPDWKASTGPVLFDNVYVGETHDARLEQAGWNMPGFDDANWQAAKVMDAPTDRLLAQDLPPMRRIRAVKPAAVLPAEDGAWILDMGQNMTGWLAIRVREPAGTVIRMTFSEHLTPSRDDIDPASTGVHVTRAPQHDIYICKGGGVEEWEPRFTYHGFRYVKVEGLSAKPDPADFTGWLVRSDARMIGSFESSDPLINKFHRVSLWTLEDNLQGVLTDCPHRERCGWLGDTHAVGEFASYVLDLGTFWRKTMDDIRTVLGDAEPAGSILPADPRAPGNISVGKRLCGQAKADWGMAMVLVPWFSYLHYGDLGIVEQNWDIMSGWINFIEEHAVKRGIITDGFGDWCPPGSNTVRQAPVPLTTTALYHQSLQAMEFLAGKLGKPQQAQRYRRLAQRTRAAFNQRFAQADGGYGSQTGTAMALWCGLVPDDKTAAAVAALEDDIMVKNHGHYSTGIFGHRPLYTLLNDHGRDSVTRHLWNITSWPSLGFMTEEHDLTTWPETPRDWPKDKPYVANSFNHPMHSGFAAAFYESLAGIRPDRNHPGFKKVILQPTFLSGLDHARAELESPYGRIVSSWKREGGQILWQFTIPANTSAELRLRAADGKELADGRDIRFLRNENGRAVFECAAGSYTIRIPES